MATACSRSSRLGRDSAKETPRDLAGHDCICYRSADRGLYSWEFEQDGGTLGVRVVGGPVVNDGDLMIAAAVDGFGLAHLMEDMVGAHLAGRA